MRAYEIQGSLYVSVTTVLTVVNRPQLNKWRVDLGHEEADRQMNEAGDLGTSVHQLCEAIASGEPWAAADERMELMANAYEDWFNTYVKKVLHVEKTCFHPLYKYAGTCDAIVIIKGDRTPTILDVKTGKGLWPEIPLQLAAYQGALVTERIHAKRRLVVHLNKEKPGVIKTKDYYDESRDFRLFTYALELWRYFNPSPKFTNIIKKDGDGNE